MEKAEAVHFSVAMIACDIEMQSTLTTVNA